MSMPFVRQYILDHPNWDKNTLDGDNPDAWMIFETAVTLSHTIQEYGIRYFPRNRPTSIAIGTIGCFQT